MKQFINHADYLAARNKLDAYEAARSRYCKEHKTNGIPVEVCKTFPFGDEVDNELRSSIEVYEFINDIPDNYFLYIDESKKEATTWMGDKLGNVSFGREYRDNLGGKRQPIDVHGINGKKYHGIYYKSSGNYARIKLFKNQ